jgi:hypothetical protein
MTNSLTLNKQLARNAETAPAAEPDNVPDIYLTKFNEPVSQYTSYNYFYACHWSLLTHSQQVGEDISGSPHA